VKAVEYYIRDAWKELGLPVKMVEFVHFGLTSQDVNDCAVPLALKVARVQCFSPIYMQIYWCVRVWRHVRGC
jgi:adenylosuccinate lyase